MDKAIDYVKEYKPIQVNDLVAQKILWDRREIYRVLKEHGIPIAKHYVVDREDQP